MRGHPLPPHTHWINTGGGGWVPRPSGPDAYERLKTPHRLVRSQYCGIVWVKEEESWRDLEICVTPKVGGAETSFRPPSLESEGVEHPPCPPPCSYAYVLSWYKTDASWDKSNFSSFLAGVSFPNKISGQILLPNSILAIFPTPDKPH